ncbi:MAG TPA: PKD domain-containing protein, partial [Solirubrobacterales bacterium]|nr:PKD domain-containing protein [Solirubrobacterales bacterium]
SAGSRGELLAVWVTQVVTVHGGVQYGLYSARLGAGGSAFGPSLLVDPNVGDGIGVDPSLAATTSGKAIVAYRAITFDFDQGTFSTAVQLHRGDVMADIRLARLNGDRWSRLGALNRNPEASMRPPSPTNGPQVGVGVDGGAVVAWQEPDQTGSARIWMRRIFGTTLGPILQASPASWEGKPVTADADAFSLSVAPYSQARVAIRIAAGSGSALAGRLLVNSLPPSYSTGAGTLSGAQLADGGGGNPLPGGVGPPDVAAAEDRERKESMRLAFLAGGQLRQMGVGPDGGVVGVALPAGPPAQTGAQPVTASDPEGGGLAAYPALDGDVPVVAVRQEFPSGAAQTGLLSGVQGGAIAELAIGRSGSGDGLIAFRQGEAGHFEVVAERVSAPPATFRVTAPKGWSRPTAVKLRWQAAPSTVGGLRYSVLVDGRLVEDGLGRRAFHPRPAQLGSGVLKVQVLATDGSGQQLLSKSVKLRVDGQRPGVEVGERHGRVTVRVHDSGSGLKASATKVSFGDGERAHGKSKFVHSYGRPGRYAIVVRAGDVAGNRTWRRFEVRVP